MSSIKQLVNKKVKGNCEVTFKAESDKGTLVLDNTFKTGPEQRISLYLLFSGSRIPVKSLFRSNSLKEDYRFETLKFMKGEEYVLIVRQDNSEENNKIGVFWE